MTLEAATQIAGVIPDPALRQLLITWMTRYSIPVEEVAQLLQVKAAGN
jgi:hypothetical protein